MCFSSSVLLLPLGHKLDVKKLDEDLCYLNSNWKLPFCW